MKYFILLLIPIMFLFTSSAQTLKNGQAAPDFQVQNVKGETIELQAYQGKSNVLLAFFRFAGCPICNLRTHELIQSYQGLQDKGFEVIAVFESNAETLKSYVEDTEIPFVMIPDPEKKLYQAYGVGKSVGKLLKAATNKSVKARMKEGETLYEGKKYKKDGSMIQTTAEFVIDKNGTLERVHYGAFVGDHIDLGSLQ